MTILKLEHGSNCHLTKATHILPSSTSHVISVVCSVKLGFRTSKTFIWSTKMADLGGPKPIPTGPAIVLKPLENPTVYPKKCAHGFVVLCFVVVMQSFIMNSHEVFIHIHQGCFVGTGAIVRLPQCQWSKPDGYGKISHCITTTKHSKALTVCIFLGIYCTSTSSPKTWNCWRIYTSFANKCIWLSIYFQDSLWVLGRKRVPSYKQGLTSIPAWISNHMRSRVWYKITYPFPNFDEYVILFHIL